MQGPTDEALRYRIVAKKFSTHTFCPVSGTNQPRLPLERPRVISTRMLSEGSLLRFRDRKHVTLGARILSPKRRTRGQSARHAPTNVEQQAGKSGYSESVGQLA